MYFRAEAAEAQRGYRAHSQRHSQPGAEANMNSGGLASETSTLLLCQETAQKSPEKPRKAMNTWRKPIQRVGQSD